MKSSSQTIAANHNLIIIITMALFLTGCAKTLQYSKDSTWSKTGITELKTVKLNGLRHEILIRGTDVNNPVVLFIHSMGIPSMCFAHLEYAQTGASIELKTTVVHYDQRGFGKTFIHGKRSSKRITIEQYVNDAEAVVSYIRNYLKKDKVFLVCESWGTVIGMHCIERHPEWYHAYFGLGQMNAVEEYLRDGYALSISEAKKAKNISGVKELEAYGPPDTNLKQKTLFKSFVTTGKWLDYYLGKRYGYDPDSGASFFFSSLWEAPEYHFYDFINTLSGYMSTQKKLISKVITVDLQYQVSSVKIPVYMILGEWDFWLPYARRYYDSLQAPQKEFFTMKDAGHMVRGDKPDETEAIIFKKIGECGM